MQDIQIEDGVSTLIRHKWKLALTVAIVLITVAFIYIILPLLDGLIMGVVLAYVARPMKQFFDRYSPKISPYLATILIVLPIFLIIGLGVIEIFNQILWTLRNQEHVISLLLDILEKLNLPDYVHDKTKDIILNFSSYLLPLLKQVPVSVIAHSFASFAIIILNVLIAIILCFFLLIDGNRLIEKITDVIPAEIDDFSRKFMKHLDEILSAIFIGNTYSAISVGILSLIVFSFFGFTNVLSLSALMLLAALIPMFAGWMIILPLAIYRYLESGSESAIIFLVVSFLVIIIPPELLIRPYIIKAHSEIHPMLIIIAFLGGGLIGGIAGFFIAPILLGAIVAAYRASSDIRKGVLKSKQQV